MESNVEEGVLYAQPQTAPERQQVAGACALGLKLSLPTLIDTMDNSADRTFNAWPERIYVLSAEGTVVHQGGKGPFDFNPEALDHFLADYLSQGETGNNTEEKAP